MMRFRDKTLIAGAMLLLAVGQAGAITTNYWTGAAGDNLWTSAGNWSLGALPDSSQAVAIENSGTNSVILDSPEWIWGLSLGGSLFFPFLRREFFLED